MAEKIETLIDQPRINPINLYAEAPEEIDSPELEQRTQNAVIKPLQQLSLTFAIVSLTLKMESSTSRKVKDFSKEIEEKEKIIHVLLDLKKELHQMKEGDPLSQKAIDSLDQLTKRGISLWNPENQLTQESREKVLDSINSEVQPLHSDVQRVVTIDLSRAMNQNSSIINIAQDILKLVSRHISNVIEKYGKQ